MDVGPIKALHFHDGGKRCLARLATAQMRRDQFATIKISALRDVGFPVNWNRECSLFQLTPTRHLS
jgi:hypothetical protein